MSDEKTIYLTDAEFKTARAIVGYDTLLTHADELAEALEIEMGIEGTRTGWEALDKYKKFRGGDVNGK